MSSNHEKLRQIRTRTDLSIRGTKLLRSEVAGADGVLRPFKLRYYQIQMILHLMAEPRFIVGDDMGLGKCVIPDTLVATDRGLLRMGDIVPSGMQSDTFQPAGSKAPQVVLPNGAKARIRSFYCGGRKPTRCITTRRGYTLEGTLVHPVFARGPTGEEGFQRLGELAVGARTCLSRSEGTFSPSEPTFTTPPDDFAPNAVRHPLPSALTPSLARLLGYLVAEGWTRNKYVFHLSQHADVNPEVHQDMRSLLRELFQWEGNEGNAERDKIIIIDSVQLVAFIRHVGIDPVLSADRRVPPCVFAGTRTSIAQFLRGYFDGDASIQAGVLEVTSASERLLREVQVLLLQFGIVSTRSPKQVQGYTHTYWRLQITGDDARRFHREVGFLSPRKAQALEALCQVESNTNLDVIPHAWPALEGAWNDLRVRVGRHGFKGGGTGRFLGTSLYNTLRHVARGEKGLTYAMLDRAHEAFVRAGVPAVLLEPLQLLRGNRFYYDEVVDIVESESEVLDIEVDHPSHSFVGNGFVNHNTIEAISTLAYLWEKNPSGKVLILTKKTVLHQWKSEFERFTDGVKVFLCSGSKAKRAKVREEFLASDGPSVIIMGYRGLVSDFTHYQDAKWAVVVLDEATVVKTPGTQVHQVCHHICNSEHAERVWGLTGTLIKNHLVEGFGIYQVVVPGLFTHTLPAFIDDYCETELINVKRGRKIKRIIGYRRSNVDRFRGKIDPFYLGRPKHAVATELPPLTTKVVKVGMSPVQAAKYAEALSGLLEVGSGEQKEVTKLTAVTYCQEIANHPGLIECEGESEKLDDLIDLLTEGDLEGEKVIVFTRFEKMVSIGVPALAKAGVKSVRITGKENDAARKASQEVFQDMKSGVPVVWITTAGSDAINLQAAKAIIFYDTPFSAGDYLQILGRMIRIGSVHDRVFALHLVATWDGKTRTIDERVMELVERKMELVEAVIGKRIKGDAPEEADADDDLFSVSGEIDDLFEALSKDAREMIRVA